MKYSVLYRIATCLVVLLAAHQAQAQLSYTFSNYVSKSQPYADLVDDVVVPGFGDDAQYRVPGLDGETFQFFGRTITVGANEFITVGQGGFVGVQLANEKVVIDGLFANHDAIDETSRISYAVRGEPGNYVIVYQHKHYALREGPAGNYFNMQIWLHQRSGVIEVRYGPRSANNATGYNVETGPNAGIFLISDAFDDVYEKLWCTGDPDMPSLDSAADFNFFGLTGVPLDGSIYSFTPRTTTSGVDDLFVDYRSSFDESPWSDIRSPGSKRVVYDLVGNECLEPLSPGMYLEYILDAKGRGRTRGFVAY